MKLKEKINIKGIDWICFDEDKQLLTTVDVLSEDILSSITEDVRVVKNKGIMYNNDILNGNWEDSIPRRILNHAFLDNYLEEINLNKMSEDYVRLLTKDEVEKLDSEFHNVSKCYWTMTFKDYDSDNWAYVFFVYGSSHPGYLNNANVYGSVPGVRPVISIKKDNRTIKDKPKKIKKIKYPENWNEKRDLTFEEFRKAYKFNFEISVNTINELIEQVNYLLEKENK